MSRKPFMKFYKGDWRADVDLRTCAPATRLLWLEIMLIMDDAGHGGELLLKKKRPSMTDLATAVALPVDLVEAGVAELIEAGVCDIMKNGVIVSRKMKRDAARSEKAQKNGRKGGNPALMKGESGENSERISGEFGENDVTVSQGDATTCDGLVKGEDKPQKPEARSHPYIPPAVEHKGESPDEAGDTPSDDDNFPPTPDGDAAAALRSAKLTELGRKQAEAERERRRVSAEVDEAQQLYDDAAKRAGWKSVRSWTGERRKKIAARLREHGVDAWREAMERGRKSPFLAGDNNRGWTASLDFFLQQSSFLKVLEGHYDQAPPQPANINGTHHGATQSRGDERRGTGNARLDAAVRFRDHLEEQGRGGRG